MDTRRARPAAALALFAAWAGLGGCGKSPEPPPAAGPPALRPGEMFRGDFLDIRAPMTPGWQLILSNQGGVVFGRAGATPGENFAGQVSIFPLPSTGTADAFVGMIRTLVEQDLPGDRFEVEQASFDFTDERGYPCVRHHAVVHDLKPAHSAEPLLMETAALYCRHPARPDTVFSIIYTHRGPALYPELQAEAAEFIAGVQVAGTEPATARPGGEADPVNDRGPHKAGPDQADGWGTRIRT